ncbi:MAG: Flp family type IVb pilin [Desulfobaccales bacterium]
MEKLGNFFKDECGATMVEYGLLLALIAVVCILAVTNLGTSLSSQFNSVSAPISSAS